MQFYMKYNVQFIFTINDISYDRLLYISQSFSIKQYIQAYHQCPITIRLQGTHKIIHTNLLLQESEASQPHALYPATCCLHLHPSLGLTQLEKETL